MAVTIQQIAERAGVSRGTVDRALNDRGRINPQVRQRICRIAEEMGYVTKSKKQAALHKHQKIGIIVFLSQRVFASEIIRGAQQAREELLQWGIQILIKESDSMNEQEQIQAIDALLEENITGLAITPIDCALVRAKLNLVTEAYGIPVVTINSDIIGTKRCCFVGMDNRLSGRLAAGLMGMLTRGSGNILIITGHLTNYANNNRVDGFMEEMKLRYPELKIAGVHCTFDDEEEVEAVVKSALLEASGISGILTVSAGQAGVACAFQSLGLEKRPYVIFFDQTPCTEEALLADTADFVIEQGCFSQGYEAAYILARILVQSHQPSDEFAYTPINIKTKYNL